MNQSSQLWLNWHFFERADIGTTGIALRHQPKCCFGRSTNNPKSLT
jgi:hypothetical protein